MWALTEYGQNEHLVTLDEDFFIVDSTSPEHRAMMEGWLSMGFPYKTTAKVRRQSLEDQERIWNITKTNINVFIEFLHFKSLDLIKA